MTPRSVIEPARHAGTALLRSQSDARLVDLTRDGNERAFEAIVQRYRRPLLRYCSRLLPLARAEDAVQQAFLSAHRAIHAGDAELNLRPWLYRIAHNASLNLLRQQGFDHDQVSEEIDGVETPPQAFERGERLRTVVAAVQELPERQRSALLLQAVDGRSYEEIASELGVTDGAVRQLLNRARNTLRDAAAAITPAGLLTRLASSGAETPVAERIAQTVAGAGGSALVAKGAVTLAVVGAVAGGAAGGGLPGGTSEHAGAASGAARQSLSAAGGDDAATHARPEAGSPGARRLAQVSDRRSQPGGRHGASTRGSHASVRAHGEDRHGRGGDGSRSGDDHSGSEPRGADDSSRSGSSGSGSGDDGGSSGSGSSGSGDGGGSSSGSSSSGSSGSGSGDDGGSSGSGSGADHVTTDSSGSGSSGSGDDRLSTDTSGGDALDGSGSGTSGSRR